MKSAPTTSHRHTPPTNDVLEALMGVYKGKGVGPISRQKRRPFRDKLLKAWVHTHDCSRLISEQVYCHTRLHLGFSAKLRIWQALPCKMEPRSGNIAKLSSSWLVQPSSGELRFALILVITPTTTHPPPTPGENSFEPLLDYLGS